MKGAEIVEKVIEGATKKVYQDPYEYSVRVIKALMSMGGEDKFVDKNTMKVLACMCCVGIDGGDYMSSAVVINKMVELGYKKIGMDTMRNYRHKIKSAGWIVDRKLNTYLQRAIADRGLGLIMFLGNGRKK